MKVLDFVGSGRRIAISVVETVISEGSSLVFMVLILSSTLVRTIS